MQAKTSVVLINSWTVAFCAANAARNWHVWGPYVARRYAERHGVPSGILTLARVLANAERAGF